VARTWRGRGEDDRDAGAGCAIEPLSGWADWAWCRSASTANKGGRRGAGQGVSERFRAAVSSSRSFPLIQSTSESLDSPALGLSSFILITDPNYPNSVPSLRR
jgi:hypothetical protein